MSKSQPDPVPSKAAPAAATAKGGAAQPAVSHGRALRETVESVVVAFVLAFLFRTFEAEAFVIPTGSMAPTLQGRHKDVTCAKCGYAYRASASEEVRLDGSPETDPGKHVARTVCPMCSYELPVDPAQSGKLETVSYNGDRILVGKGLYEFFEPRRWDVVVFKYPGDAKVNYIKRLVGLPGEHIVLAHGDAFAAQGPAAPAQILRKPADKLRGMLQIVYDNDYTLAELTERGWPLRWQNWPGKTQPWKSGDGGKSFAIEGRAAREAWLRYQHFVPGEEDWDYLQSQHLPAHRRPKPLLITDHYAYNDRVQRQYKNVPLRADSFGVNWVGDLAVSCTAEVQSAGGKLMLDLVKAGRSHRCTIDLASGRAELSVEGVPNFRPAAATAVRGPGKYELMFSNCDRQLLLWVNGSVASFGDDPLATAFEPRGADEPSAGRGEKPGDLAPAGVGSAGATVAVSHLRLYRDVYYIADKFGLGSGNVISENPELGQYARWSRREFLEFLSTPSQWQLKDGRVGSVFSARREVDFPLGPDEFFMLGDNSPASKDSRLWEGQTKHVVERKLLIGKAVYIYWPHGWPTGINVALPLLGGEIRVPFYPNFKRMRLIH